MESSSEQHPEGSADPVRRRRRPPLACIACRRRKVRCDRKIPCQNCVRARRVTSCVYVPDDRLEPRDRAADQQQDQRGGYQWHTQSRSQDEDGRSSDCSRNDPGPSAATTSGASQGIGPYLKPNATASNSSVDNHHHQHPPPLPAPLPPSHAHHGVAHDSATSSPVEHGNASALAERVRHLEQQLSEVLAATKSSTSAAIATPMTAPSTNKPPPHNKSRIASTHVLSDEYFAVGQGTHRAHYRDGPTEATSNAATGGLLAKARYLGSSHWVHAITLFQPSTTLLTFLDSLKSDKTSELYQTISACKTLGKSIKAGRIPRLLSLEFGNHMPAREVADELLGAYLRTFETVYRIVHVPSFRQEYEKYWQNPQAAREVFVIQLQLCMALGAVVRDEKFSLRRLAIRWIHEARLWFLQPSEKSRVNLSGLQVGCLVHLARDVCGVGSDLVWASAGTLMRMAVYIGLHRDPEHLPAMSLCAAESRRRVWATILEILVQSSMESGGPPLISDKDYDCKPPGNYNDEDLVNEATSPVPLPKPATTITDSSVQIALLNSVEIRLQIASYLNDFRSAPSYDKTLSLNAELTAASRSLDALLRVYQAQSPGLSSFQLSMVEHLTQRYFFALHLPWLGCAKDDPRYSFSRKVTVEIAMRNHRETKAHGALGSDSSSDTPEPDDFGRLLICGTGGYRYLGTQCLLALTVELVWNLEEQRSAMRSLTAGEAASALTPSSSSSSSSCGSSSSPSATARPRTMRGLGFGILGAQADISKEMFRMLHEATVWMRARIRAGEVNVKGYLFGKCMLAEITGLQDGADEEELRRLVQECGTEATTECLGLLRALGAAEAAQMDTGVTGSAPPGVGMGSVAVPKYTGMDGSVVPGPGDGSVFGSIETGSSGAMTDWDWDVLQDPNYNFSLNLSLGGMDLIFGSE